MLARPNGAPAPSAPRQDAAERRRVGWVDAARGLGIVLVVYGHAVRGQLAAGLYPPTAAVLLQDALIYAFHMPLFFVLSGLVSGGGAVAGGWRSFLRTRGLLIVYPYLLWSLAQGLLSILAARHANSPQSFAALALIAWSPIGQFWFLYILFLCQLTLLLPRWLAYALVPLAVAVNLRFGWTNMLTGACGYFPYFAAGLWLTAPRVARWLDHAPRAWAIAALAWSGFALLAVLGDATPLGAGMAAAGTVGAVALAGRIDRRSALLAALGRASLAIFVAHVICAAAARAVLRLVMPDHPVAMLALVTLAGLALPYAAYRAADRLGLTLPLGLGRSTREAPARGG